MNKLNESNKTIVIGAGMSGLLYGALHSKVTIYDKNDPIMENHKALFRCKTNKISLRLDIPFVSAQVQKAIWFQDNEVQPSPRFTHLYSQKVTGKISDRSIQNIDFSQRFIAPNDFFFELQKKVISSYDNKLIYNAKIDISMLKILIGMGCNIISTIPMPIMLDMLDVKYNIDFSFQPIYINKIPLKKCNSYCTIYYPDPSLSTYRASITGDFLIIESIDKLTQDELYKICDSFGIIYTRQFDNHIKNHMQEVGKIEEIDENFRKNIITQLTLKHNIYSLGRLATWRPKVVLDEVYEDIYHIDRMLDSGQYDILKYKQNSKQ